MADTTTQHRPRTGPAATAPAAAAPVRTSSSRTWGLVSMVVGALGVVAAVVPISGFVALFLAAVAIGTGVPAMRRGPHAACFATARLGVVLGMIAVLLGFLSLAMQLLD